MIPSSIKPWIVLGIAVAFFSALIGSAYSGYKRGKEEVQLQWDAAAAQWAKENADQQRDASNKLLVLTQKVREAESRARAKTVALQAQYEETKDAVDKAYDTALADYRKRYGMRAPTPAPPDRGGSRGATAGSTSSGEPPSATSALVLSPQMAEDTYRLFGEADQLAAAYATCLQDRQ